MTEPFINIPREYTAIAEWLFSMLFIVFLNKRFTGFKLYALIIVWFFIFLGYQLLAGILPIYMWIPGMIGAVILMWACIYSIAKMSLIATGFYAIQAFIMAEFAASFEWQIYYFYLIYEPDNLVFSFFLMILLYGIIFLFLYLFEKRYKRLNKRIDIRHSDFWSIFITGLIVFTISNLSFIDVDVISPFTGRYPAEIFYIRTLVDFAGIVLFYVQREHKNTLLIQNELSATQNLLNKHYQQYTISQNSINVINQKYHDLKHQINIIREEKDINKQEQYLIDMEQGIKMYEAQYKTGYHVLDTILTSKGFTCIEEHINLNVVADGKLLEAMQVMDIAALFGNAIDNAIESCKQTDDFDKRLINVALFKQNNLAFIRIENYYEHPLKYEDGKLITTKSNRNIHGYGIKSIQNIIDKYNGNLSIHTENNWFKLMILLPIEKRS